MKRIIVFLVTAVIICVAFASCGEDDPYSNIGDMLEADHKKVELTVTVNAMEGELTSKYTLVNNGSNKKMTYTYEKLNTFDKVNGSYVIPESYKSTYSGSVTVENGRIVEQNGAQTDIDIESVASPKFEFNEDCFSSALIKEGYFEADISDPNTFLGVEGVYNSTKVVIKHDSEKINEMTVSYVSGSGANVTLKFLFE